MSMGLMIGLCIGAVIDYGNHKQSGEEQEDHPGVPADASLWKRNTGNRGKWFADSGLREIFAKQLRTMTKSSWKRDVTV